MSAEKIITPGTKFGRLVVLKKSERPKKYLCRCQCGNEKEILSISLRSGITVSCGCFRLERLRAKITTHGHGSHLSGRSPTYSSWLAMIARCENPKNKKFAIYGGNGIQICRRWRESFDYFLADMGERPDGMTLDRYPNRKGHYEPGNCRWATAKQQARNVCRNRLLTFQGKTKPLAQWADELGINYHTLHTRIKEMNWDTDRALTVSQRDDIATEVATQWLADHPVQS